jgi:hypothetical protein
MRTFIIFIEKSQPLYLLFYFSTISPPTPEGEEKTVSGNLTFPSALIIKWKKGEAK